MTNLYKIMTIFPTVGIRQGKVRYRSGTIARNVNAAALAKPVPETACCRYRLGMKAISKDVS